MKVQCTVSTDDAKDKINNLFRHISSWFGYVETRKEFEVSYKTYLKKIENYKETIGDHAIIAIEDIIKNILQKEKYLFHYNFIGKSTMGCKGSSSCESSFSSLKKGSNKNSINSNTRIHKSTMSIIDLSEKQSRRKEIISMNNLNRHVTWSKSKVADVLNKYPLGVFNDHYDRRLEHEKYLIGHMEWLVVHINFGKNKDVTYPHFDRVRRVHVTSDGFLNCTCGETGEYLLPCRHVCRIIDDVDDFTSEMFHTRWHKLCAHSMSNKYESMFKNTQPVLRKILKETRETHYNNDGTCKGVPIPPFLLDKFSTCNDFSLCDRKKFILDHYKKSKDNPILCGGYKQEDFQEDANVVDSNTIDYEEPVSFSMCSQSEHKISDNVEQNKTAIVIDANEKENIYNIINPALQAALEACETMKDAEGLNDVLMSYLFKLTSKKRNPNADEDGVSFFGENTSNSNEDKKRHLFAYERRHKKKKN